MSLVDKTAVELSEGIRQKTWKPSEVAEAFLARAEETKDYNAFITVDGEAVLRRAKELDGVPVTAETHPLFGLPVAVKDNIATKDLPTTCASKMLENFRPPYDAEVVTRLREAGAVILGKTNMDEFAMGTGTDSNVINPRSSERSPGGSSSGSAAAVAARSAPFALGSDTGGSIRLPAACCGIVGYKPSYGMVSRNGLFAYAGSFDQIGPMARTVEDAALLMSAISDRPFTLNTELDGYRAGVLGGDVSVSLMEQALSIYYVIAFCEASSNFAIYDGVRFSRRSDGCDLYTASRTEGFGDEVRRRLWLGTYMLSAGKYEQYYKKARIAQEMLKEEMDKAFERFDVLIAPVEPGIDVIANLCGLPAIAVGSRQFIGKRFDDANLLGFAQRVAADNGDCGRGTRG
jgi:aspartyl-tRNA(Asn)/glutamyl-tRNA(Gln) amidotransferase subunit A